MHSTRQVTNNTFQRLRRDERGMTLMFIAIAFLGFMAASAIAIDVGMFMTARSQAQNSADAGALAGATALVFNDYNDRTPSGPAVQSAKSGSTANQVIRANVSVKNSDVTFPVGPTGLKNRVQVSVYRTQARGNPVPSYLGPLFGVPTVNIMATATAEASDANAETCVMPFTIPDKWIEKQCGPEICPWDPTDTFDMYDSKGNLLPNPDIYIPPGQPNPTGFNEMTDRGLELVLKANNGSKIAPSMYNPWDLPGSIGANDYSNNIANCNPAIFQNGDMMPPENGNMVGPTTQGTTALVAKDPNAYWDTSCNCVKGSAYGISPRIAVVPLYNPIVYAQGQQSGKNAQLQMVNYLGFFIEGINGGGQVTGRITPITGLINVNGPSAGGAFAKVIRLVQ
jgi:Flp pilus assembly protein TadG